ncbi:hypothetical protein [Ulvibacterium sp.]|uniref:hypothetical protein n=1 Tax=Ulvibacterium sp. TaxID=2665914 RepID=UPI003BABBB21
MTTTEELIKVLENSRTYTLAMAEAMPEETFDHQIVKDHWKFNDLINHIAYSIV